MGLSALAATVVRVAPALLFGLCSTEGDKPEPILGELGQLERHILWQLALAENWKRDQDAAKEAAKGTADLITSVLEILQFSTIILVWYLQLNCTRMWVAVG